ncbi:MAG: 30S ribosomal protein S5 [Bdellovibrionales bacterium]|jgi:small subunit ribosomal protein S5|nr:30S ribosomal protein S5 [Bdellovibrionales bacterium]
MVDEKEVKNNDENAKAAPEGKKAPRNRKPAPKRKRPESVDPELEERVVAVNRVAKVVKGGRRFSFSALIIVGDKKGHVGFGLGKAKEVPEAIRKATQAAEKNMINVPIDGGTIPHQVLGEFDAGKILFKPAADGTGIKAAGACRSILELAGIHNVLTKSLRGNNPHNVVKATFQALKQLRSPEQIAKVRGIEVKQVRLK